MGCSFKNPEEWVRVSLLGFSRYWVNIRSGKLYNEVSGKFPGGSKTYDGYRKYHISAEGLDLSLRASQLVYYSFHGYSEIPKELEVDHKDRDRSNDDINNLRLVSKRINAQNNGSSLPPGVSYSKQEKVFVSQIGNKCKQYRLGGYPLPCLAAKAYEKAEQQINEGTFNPPDWNKQYDYLSSLSRITKGTSKYPGVSKRPNGKWQARRKGKYLGVYDTEELAYEAIIN